MTEPHAKRAKLEHSGKVIVDPDGDAILTLGADESNPELSVLVSSKVLSVASKVFKAMFSRNFKEGNDLVSVTGSLPLAVPLPDDDPEAMLTLCKVLHHDADVQPECDVGKLKKFAAVADKYDCALAAMFYGRVWLSLFWKAETSLPAILSIAYLFNDPHTFKKVSATLLTDNHGYQSLRALRNTAPSLPLEICDAFLKRRLKLERSTSTELVEPIDSLAKRGCWNGQTDQEVTRHNQQARACTKQSRTFQYIQSLQNANVWPIEAHDWHLGLLVASLDTFSMEVKNTCCTDCCVRLNAHVQRVKEKLEEKVRQGLCLDCILRDMGQEKQGESDSESATDSEEGSQSSDENADADSESDTASESDDDDEEEVDDSSCRVKHH